MSIAAGLETRGSIASDLAALHASIDALAERVDREGTGEGAHLKSVERAARRLDSVKLAIIAQADRARAGDGEGHASTSTWVDHLTRSGGRRAAAQVLLATSLEESAPATRTALAEGEVSSEAAGIIASAMERLPDELTDTERGAVEASLLRDARTLEPARLRRSATRALAAAERSAAEVDADQDRLLATRETRAYAAARLTMIDHPDGTTTGQFTVPTLAAQMLKKVLDAMVSPRRDHLRANSGNDDVDSADSGGSASAPAPVSLSERDRDWADLDWVQKRGRALVEILEHLPTDQLSSRTAATLIVTTELDTLRGGLRAAGCEAGFDLSAGEVRRLACTSGIVPAVLGGESVPLDLGRRRRHFSEQQRTALAVIYETCAEEHCGRPFSWCEIHHDHAWEAGGLTTLDNAIPLCGFHHRLIDDARYRHTVTTHGRERTVHFTRRT